MKTSKTPLYLFIASVICFIIAASFFVVTEFKANKTIQEQQTVIQELQEKNKILEEKVTETCDLYNELEIDYNELKDFKDTLIVENEELKALATTEAGTEEVTTQAPKKETSTTAAPKKEEVTTECVTTATEEIIETTEAVIEKPTEETFVEASGEEYFEGVKLQYSAPYNITDNKLTATKGVVKFNGHKECYYTQTLLPGKTLYLPGRHVAEDGTIRDGDGYICVAADLKFFPRYSKVMTSLGPGKVYDTGCAYGTVDIYTDW